MLFIASVRNALMAFLISSTMNIHSSCTVAHITVSMDSICSIQKLSTLKYFKTYILSLGIHRYMIYTIFKSYHVISESSLLFLPNRSTLHLRQFHVIKIIINIDAIGNLLHVYCYKNQKET